MTDLGSIGERGFNEASFRKLIQFNIDAGAHRFWIAGGAGESVLLADEENRRIAAVSVEECRGRP